MSDDPSALPAALDAAIRDLITASGLVGVPARELRADLEEHVRDGLEAGRDPDDLARRLGDPAAAAPFLTGVRPPSTRRPDPEGGEGALSAFRTDLRLTVRALRRSKGLTLAAMAVLGVGIAATSVAFTVVNEIFLRPLPVIDQERLVDVWAIEPGGNSFAGFGWQDVLAYREAAEAGTPLASLAAFSGVRVSLGEGAGQRPVVGQLISQDYFPMLGVSAELGRVGLEEDPAFGGPRTTVLSHALWSDAFAADPDIVGRSIVLDGEAITVVGVAARGFRGHFIGFPVDFWLPITAADLVLPAFDPNDRARMPFEMIGRLGAGGSVVEVEGSLNAIASTLEALYPETHRGHRVGVTRTSGVDHSLRPIVLTFVAVVTVLASLVLLIACFNVGSLLLVRTLAREGELAIRLALGAGRGRLVRQLLTEALVLAGLGAAVGLVLSRVLSVRVDALFRQLAPGLGLELPFDGRVLGLTAGAAAIAAVVAGSAPAWHTLRRAPANALGARSAASAGSRSRATLVVAQMAVSVALVITTGLFVRALIAGTRVDPGFAADEVASFILTDDEAFDSPRLESVLRDLREIPGVLGASVADGPPTGVARTPTPVRVPGMEPPPGEDAWIVDSRRVGADYLTTIGVRLSRGRDIAEADAREGPPVAVVNQAFVNRFWTESDPLGNSLEIGGGAVTVVGVATNARTVVQDDTPDPFIYVSLAGMAPRLPVVTLRGVAPEDLTSATRATVAQHAPGLAPPVLVPAREVLDTGLLAQRLGAALIGAIGAAALLLAIVGLFGLVQYSVSRDRHELAVRLALGGSRAAVMRSVLRKGLLLVAVGAVAGVLLAIVGSPALSSFLLGVSPRDPATYALVVLLFTGVATIACAVPARRAMSIPPAAVLRGE